MKSRIVYPILLVVIVSLLFTGCAKHVTKGEKFPLMYEEKPVTILVLPPMNHSTAADAKEYYATTIAEPLSLSGYYIYPIEVTSEMLKMEGIYDTELLLNTPLQKFYQYFGADAVLFTTIEKWDVAYLVIASNLTVSVDCVLKSTRSGQTLWKYKGTVIVDLSGGNTGGGLGGLIVKAVVAAVKTATADYVPYARQANYQALKTMPAGKYSAENGKDQGAEFVDQEQKPEQKEQGQEQKQGNSQEQKTETK